MRFARGRVRATAASLFLLDDDLATLRGVISEWDWTRTSFSTELRHWPNVERALRDGKPRLITVRDAVDAETVWFEPRGIASTVCVPLCVGARAVGVIFFDFDAAHGELDASGFAVLVALADRSARSLERWRIQSGAAAPVGDVGAAYADA
jgi:hypothetical protein